MKFAIISILITCVLAGPFLIEQTPFGCKIKNLNTSESTMLAGHDGTKVIRNKKVLNKDMPFREYVCRQPDTTFTGNAKEVFCGEFLDETGKLRDPRVYDRVLYMLQRFFDGLMSA